MVSKKFQKLDKARRALDEDIEAIIKKLETEPVTKAGIKATELLEKLEGEELKLEEKELVEPPMTFGERLADDVAKYAGSWGFISIFALFLVVWMALNVVAWINTWDPYPFILLNLVLSCIAAVQAPIIMMSQNRQAVHDRERDEIGFQRTKMDLQVDTMAAKGVRNAEIGRVEMLRKLAEIDKKLDKVLKK
jgi:uncharacterized membrane protein